MSEAFPHDQSELESRPDYQALYKEAHPNAVDDKAKAEAMAYAGDEEETKVVAHRNEAMYHAAKAGDPDSYDHYEAAHDHAEEARDARGLADLKEDLTGKIYDETKDL